MIAFREIFGQRVGDETSDISIDEKVHPSFYLTGSIHLSDSSVADF